MRNFIVYLVGFLMFGFFNISAVAADQNKPEEAIALVKKAIAQYKQEGREKTFADINKLDGKYVGKEMFTLVLDQKGVVVAHGYYHKMIGQNIMNMRDTDGVEMVKAFFEVIRTKGSGWVYYRFPNPATKQVEPKMTYVESWDNLIFACGLHYSQPALKK